MFFTVFSLLLIWAGLLFAPYRHLGLYGIIKESGNILNNPFGITFCRDSVPLCISLLLIFSAGVYIHSLIKRAQTNAGDFGSAFFEDPLKIGLKYCPKENAGSKILTENVSMSLDTHRTMRNLNTLVCGGSGAGKTRFFCMPNIINADNCSLFVLDPKGELLRDTGAYLEKKGYRIKVLNLVSMENSNTYNPFSYLYTDNDVQRLVTNLFSSTSPKEAKSSDPFWDTAAKMLLMALVFYLHLEAPVYEQNFSTVLELLRCGMMSSDESTKPTVLDKLFYELEKKDPSHIAVKYYKNYRTGAVKTLKSIQITLASRLEKFNLSSLEKLTNTDEMDIDGIGEEKTALFAIIPDNDSSFNFMVSILYTQIFQRLFYLADTKYRGELKIPVHFIMDEFANVSLPADFPKILSTMRSRGIFVSIILQNLSQLKALYDREWESVIGNCDEFLYLGGNEQSTHKYVSELLGKRTLRYRTSSRQDGLRGHYSMSENMTSRDLLLSSEVRVLDNRDAILFIRGENAVKDRKYDISRFPGYPFEKYDPGKVSNYSLRIRRCDY